MSVPVEPRPEQPSTDDQLPLGAFTEAEWYAKIYQGDNVPQLTWRAVITGGLLGMLMALANLYTTLKIGWSFPVAITSCVLSYVMWNALRLVARGGLGQLSILENNCMQSTASAAGYSTGASIGTAFGALLLLSGHHEAWWIVGVSTLFTGLLGVFLAVPLKRQMINRERLAFPSGIAAAATLKSLYSRGGETMRQAHVLVGSLVGGVMIGICNTGEGALRAVDAFFARVPWLRLPEQIPAAGYATIGGRQLLGFGFEPSGLLIAAGMITGLRVSLSMLAGSLMLYLVVGPKLIALDAANAVVEGYKISIPVIGGGTIYHLPRWALWGGTSVMVFASLAVFALQWRTVARSFRWFKKAGATVPAEDAALEATMVRIEVPTAWLVVGLVPVTIGLLAVNAIAFHISLWLGLVAVAMSFVLSLVACRATGETDTTPIGAMGKVMQLIFAVLSPPSATNVQVSVQHNLMAAGTVANASSSSADLLTDLKSGYLLGANPRRQFIAQLIGIFFGTVAVVPAWYLMVPNKEVLEAMNPPSTNMWRAVAELLAGGGVDQLPASAKLAIVLGAVVGVVIPVTEALWPRLRPWLPSCMGLGLAWVMTFSNCQSFAIGAVLVWLWTKARPKNAESYYVPVASGLIAGESLIKALIAIAATTLGLLGLN